MKLGILVFAVLLALKVAGVTALSWFWVISPLWIAFVVEWVISIILDQFI